MYVWGKNKIAMIVIGCLYSGSSLNLNMMVDKETNEFKSDV